MVSRATEPVNKNDATTIVPNNRIRDEGCNLALTKQLNHVTLEEHEAEQRAKHAEALAAQEVARIDSPSERAQEKTKIREDELAQHSAALAARPMIGPITRAIDREIQIWCIVQIQYLN